LRDARGPAILGYALYQCGWREEAMLVLEKSIILHPRLATSYGYLSDVLFVVGKGDEAIAAARKAIELDPVWFSPHASLSWFLHERVN
jgi:tetratricopeptide (TPR) repeat protein